MARKPRLSPDAQRVMARIAAGDDVRSYHLEARLLNALVVGQLVTCDPLSCRLAAGTRGGQ